MLQFIIKVGTCWYTRTERIRTIVMTKEIEKYRNLGEVQDSADSRRKHLVEISEKYKQGIQLLNISSKESSTRHQQKVNELESNSAWRELRELKSKLRSDVHGIVSKLQEKPKLSSRGLIQQYQK